MISQTVEYALRAMVYVAAHGDMPVSAERIAQQAGIPAGYLSKIMRSMVVSELVESTRGRRGGFVLKRRPGEISLLEIMNAVDPVRRVRGGGRAVPEGAALLDTRIELLVSDVERAFRATTLAEVAGIGSAAGHAA